jgi:hypothetical protein
MFLSLSLRVSCGEVSRLVTGRRVCLIWFPVILSLTIGFLSCILEELCTGSIKRR